MAILRRVLLGAAMLFALKSSAADLQLSDADPLRLPSVGSYQLRIISPALLELTYVTGVRQGAERPEQWDLVNRNGQIQLPALDEYAVTANGKRVAVKGVGFKRRVLYAPFKRWDLRLGNYLYLQLTSPVEENEMIEVKSTNQK